MEISRNALQVRQKATIDPGNLLKGPITDSITHTHPTLQQRKEQQLKTTRDIQKVSKFSGFMVRPGEATISRTEVLGGAIVPSLRLLPTELAGKGRQKC